MFFPRSRYSLLLACWIVLLLSGARSAVLADHHVTKYLRFQVGDTVAYGILEGNRVRRIHGDLFGQWVNTDITYGLNEIKILAPSAPSKVIALAGNYKDHLGDKAPPAYPEPFFKLPSCLQRHEAEIVQPPGTEKVHYEAEVVVVIGKRAKNVSVDDALDYVLGITNGNDISARAWQQGDVQWWRAKASDTFGPCGPYITSGLDYNNLDMELRVNGEVRQKTNTRNMIHNIAETVSFVSRHCTLEPGDLIFTGTPGKTRELSAGDVVEVEIEGVGVLRNYVVGPKETKPAKYLRFRAGHSVSYGVLEGNRVRKLAGAFGNWEKTDTTYALHEIDILVPTEPTKVLALAGNYRDHLGDKAPPPFPAPFIKAPSCLQRHEGPIVQPPDTESVHYEAEVVIVIGKEARNVPPERALDYVLGITCGNDVSARVWQSGDVQWWRGKGSDTFGPCGPFVASGIDYGNLEMVLRVNGEIKQKTNTRNMIHNIADTVSFISQHVTLNPGDLIFTGTTGKTTGLSVGDVVEVEIEGVGVLRNRVVAAE